MLNTGSLLKCKLSFIMQKRKEVILMSEFIAKIRAELDSKELEQKLDSLTKESRKVKVEVDTSKMDETVKSTEKIKNKEIKVKTQIDGTKDIKKIGRAHV